MIANEAGESSVTLSSRKKAGAVIMLIGLAMLVYLSTLPALATSGTGSEPSLDSSVSGATNGGFTMTLPALTVQAGDLVMVHVGISPQSSGARGTGYYPKLTSVTSPQIGLSLRFSWTVHDLSGDGSYGYEYYGIAPTTGQVSITEATNASQAAFSSVAYSVSGVNQQQPFDNGINLFCGGYASQPGGCVVNGPSDNITTPGGDGSNPNMNDCNPAGSAGCATWFTTAAGDTMVVAGIASQGCPAVRAPSAGFILIGSACAPFGITTAVAFDVYTAPQSGTLTGGWCLTPGNGTPCQGESALWWADALQACSGSSCSVVTSSSTATGTTTSASTTIGASTTSTTVSSSASSLTTSSSTTQSSVSKATTTSFTSTSLASSGTTTSSASASSSSTRATTATSYSTTQASGAPSSSFTTALSSATPSSSGNIPEFPYQLLAVAIFTALAVVAYLLAAGRETPQNMEGRNTVKNLRRNEVQRGAVQAGTA